MEPFCPHLSEPCVGFPRNVKKNNVFVSAEIKKEVSSPISETCPEPISVTNSFTGENPVINFATK